MNIFCKYDPIMSYNIIVTFTYFEFLYLGKGRGDGE